MSHSNLFSLCSDEYVFGPGAVYSVAARNDSDDMIPEESAYREVRKRTREENACEDGSTKTMSLHDEKMRLVSLIRGIASSKFANFGLLDEAILLEFLCVVVSCDTMWSYARTDARVHFKRKTGYYDVLEIIVQELQNVSFFWNEHEDVWDMALNFPHFLVPLHRLIDVALSHCTLLYNTLVYQSFGERFLMLLRHNIRDQNVTRSTMLLYFVLLSSEDTLDELKHFLMRIPFEYQELQAGPQLQPLDTMDVALLTGMRTILKNTDFGNLMYNAIQAKSAIDTPRKCIEQMSALLKTLM
jgi:hypothetical protein